MERLVTRCLGCVQKSRRTRLREAFLTQGRRSIRLPKVRQRALFLERYRSSAVAATVNIFTLKGTSRQFFAHEPIACARLANVEIGNPLQMAGAYFLLCFIVHAVAS